VSRDGPKEHNGGADQMDEVHHKFKDDEMINDDEIINEGQLGRV
jgi:hypothetical protein